MTIPHIIKTALGCAALVLALSQNALAQQDCRIEVSQNEKMVAPILTGDTAFYGLEPREFSVSISPASCVPSIGTLPNAKVKELLGRTPLIYSSRWAYQIAATEAQADILVWWAQGAVAQDGEEPPSASSFAGKRYQALCAELGYCPRVQPSYSSSWPFEKDIAGGRSKGTFKRLEETRPLAAARGMSVPSVIYTLWRALPSEYPMRDPDELVFKPHFVTFFFK